jgi:hypothetical protein
MTVIAGAAGTGDENQRASAPVNLRIIFISQMATSAIPENITASNGHRCAD